MNQWDVIYQYQPAHRAHLPDLVIIKPASHRKTRYAQNLLNPAWATSLGIALIAFSLGGILGPLSPEIRMEGSYLLSQAKVQLSTLYPKPYTLSPKALPASAPLVFAPLTTPDGASIDPVNTSFSIIVPKVGINAPIVANVDPARADAYNQVLKTAVAHASTSFTPDKDGTVYLFSHSTNYDWFVKDLNAVFYLLKNLDKGDTIVVFYKGVRYTYILKEKKIVSPKDVSYLVPTTGKKSLILQTCWPPGSTTERLLLFADMVEEKGVSI